MAEHDAFSTVASLFSHKIIIVMKYNEIIHKKGAALNHEGAAAFGMSPEMELYTAAVTSALSGKFYESAGEVTDRISDLVRRVDPVFVAQLAVYTRTRMLLRSVPLLLLVELAKCHSGDNLVARAVARTVIRADEICELLACYQRRNPSEGIKKLGRLSRQIQNGLKEAFNRFDEYQFAKYDRKDAEIKLRDALFLVHPKAKDAARQAVFDKIAAGTLDTPYTWETRLSALGQQSFDTREAKAAAVKALWEELLDSGKLGYMALLRNLRNIMQAGVSPQHVERLCRRLADPEQVARSKQMPHRFLAAYMETMDMSSPLVGMVHQALEQAVVRSADNIEGFDADTGVLLACDVSGSMYVSAGGRSSIRNADIGLLLASIFRTRCKTAIAGIFGDTWKLLPDRNKPVLAATVDARRIADSVGFSTNGYKVIDWLADNDVKMDKVMIFTDCQMWDSHRGYYMSDKEIKDSWHRYKGMHPQSKLYLFDLAGYGDSPLDLAEKDVYLIAGWNDRIFDVLSAVDNGADALAEIRKTDL